MLKEAIEKLYRLHVFIVSAIWSTSLPGCVIASCFNFGVSIWLTCCAEGSRWGYSAADPEGGSGESCPIPHQNEGFFEINYSQYTQAHDIYHFSLFLEPSSTSHNRVDTSDFAQILDWSCLEWLEMWNEKSMFFPHNNFFLQVLPLKNQRLKS